MLVSGSVNLRISPGFKRLEMKFPASRFGSEKQKLLETSKPGNALESRGFNPVVFPSDNEFGRQQQQQQQQQQQPQN